MKLRKLELKDAPLMLEWMHDKSVVEDLRTNFLSKTLEDCVNFIKNSWNDDNNLNLAITDKDDIYMGTVSLKNIKDSTAEFGITVRNAAMGKGYAIDGMKEMLRIAFEEMSIYYVYWCVSPENHRAVRFYDKNGFQRVKPEMLDHIDSSYSIEQINYYIWYQVENSEDI